MDVQIVLGVVGGAVTVGTALVAITVHATRTRGMSEETMKGLGHTDHKVRNIEMWKSGLHAHLDTTYVRKDVMAVHLEGIQAALEEIKETLKKRGSH